MKLDLNKFYNTNYKDFVHKEAVEEALKRVPELELKDVEIENILSLTFSVDQHGENPMYIEYLDKEGKKHLVRIRPAVTEEIKEILKNYETKEEHQTDVENIYNYFETLNVPMEVRSQNSLDEEGNKNIIMNNDNAFISFQVDPEQADAIQWLAIQNKNGALGDQYQYLARFVDFAKVDEVPSNADFAEKLQELEEKMNTADNNVLVTSKEYTDSNISSLANELNVKIEQTKNDLTVLIDEKAEDTLQQAKEYADSKDSEYFETGKRYTDNAKQNAINESKTYTDTKHSEVTQQVTELSDDVSPLISKLSNIWGGHKASFIYWLPNIDVNTMKLENTENDVKVTLNDGDVVYWRKNEYQPVDLSNYYTKTESDEKYATKTDMPTVIDIKVDKSITPTNINYRRDTNAVEVFKGDTELLNGAFITHEQSNNIANNTTKLSEIPNTGKVPNISWYPDGTSNYWRLNNDGEYVRTHINDFNNGNNETITYLPKFKPLTESQINDKISNVSGTTISFGDYKYNNISLDGKGILTDTESGEMLGILPKEQKLDVTDEEDRYYTTGRIKKDYVVINSPGKYMTNRLNFLTGSATTITANTAPILGDMIALPEIQECYSCAYTTHLQFKNCIDTPSISEWNVRKIITSDPTTSWDIGKPTGSFTISGNTYFNYLEEPVTEYEGCVYDRVRIMLKSSPDWGMRPNAVYPGTVTLSVGSGTSALISTITCLIRINGPQLFIDFIDKTALKAFLINYTGRKGTAGYMKIKINSD